MYEGHNEITFSKETANNVFSKFFSDFFQVPVKVTGIESDYRGVCIEFTEAVASEPKAPEEPNDELPI